MNEDTITMPIGLITPAIKEAHDFQEMMIKLIIIFTIGLVILSLVGIFIK